MRSFLVALVVVALAVVAAVFVLRAPTARPTDPALDQKLLAVLQEREFDGRIESKLEDKLGRPIDARLADLGHLLFFDPILSLTRDNSCSGCHGPNVSFNDSKEIAIGIGNNGVVGPDRAGPFNQRRAPSILNAAFFPRLMWDSRFASNAIDPFDNSRGFSFPEPDGPNLSHLETLLVAQAFTPVTTRVEMAGSFAGDFPTMRAEIASRVDAVEEYHRRFAEIFPEIAGGAPLRYEHIGRALAEFQYTLIRANAPLDRFARGEAEAMSLEEKRGALLFFGPAQCGECHNVHGFANQMFSDFEPHVLGVPQIVPENGILPFDGPNENEDYGLEQQTHRPYDRYKFRTSPLRNAAYQPSYMHNGAFKCLSDAIRHHLNARESLRDYRLSQVDPSLHASLGPSEPMLTRLHEFIQNPADIDEQEFQEIYAFVSRSLTDPRAAPQALRSLVPESVPSGLPVHRFEFPDRPVGPC